MSLGYYNLVVYMRNLYISFNPIPHTNVNDDNPLYVLLSDLYIEKKTIVVFLIANQFQSSKINAMTGDLEKNKE